MATKATTSTLKATPKAKPIKNSAAPSLASMERLRWRRKLTERVAIAVVCLFLVGVGVAAWLTEGQVFSAPLTALRSLESKEGLASSNASVNCRHPKNKNTPYCQERAAEVEGQWQGISRIQGGKAAPFKLTSPGK